MTQIALFGTSADPPTAAHQQILKWLSYHYDRVLVWASDNPFKTHQTPLEHRATMLRLLISDLEPPRPNVVLDQALSSPRALVTVQRSQQQFPEANFTLVVGSDLISQLPTWYRVETLLQQVKLLVVPRPGHPLAADALGGLRQMGGDVAIADLTGLPVSSTAYREAGDTTGITPPVEAYIHREQLYACQDVSQESLR
ncbi:MAG: nicotinate-nucleotide adenylyltransferase [Synechococcales bacterium]|nr:nicotinate-nucleotide adenylyltransferase [Synechococcales bacterium]